MTFRVYWVYGESTLLYCLTAVKVTFYDQKLTRPKLQSMVFTIRQIFEKTREILYVKHHIFIYIRAAFDLISLSYTVHKLMLHSTRSAVRRCLSTGKNFGLTFSSTIQCYLGFGSLRGKNKKAPHYCILSPINRIVRDAKAHRQQPDCTFLVWFQITVDFKAGLGSTKRRCVFRITANVCGVQTNVKHLSKPCPDRQGLFRALQYPMRLQTRRLSILLT